MLVLLLFCNIGDPHAQQGKPQAEATENHNRSGRAQRQQQQQFKATAAPIWYNNSRDFVQIFKKVAKTPITTTTTTTMKVTTMMTATITQKSKKQQKQAAEINRGGDAKRWQQKW